MVEFPLLSVVLIFTTHPISPCSRLPTTLLLPESSLIFVTLQLLELELEINPKDMGNVFSNLSGQQQPHCDQNGDGHPNIWLALGLGPADKLDQRNKLSNKKSNKHH